jgi:hypothetical protein
MLVLVADFHASPMPVSGQLITLRGLVILRLRCSTVLCYCLSMAVNSTMTPWNRVIVPALAVVLSVFLLYLAFEFSSVVLHFIFHSPRVSSTLASLPSMLPIAASLFIAILVPYRRFHEHTKRVGK